MLLLDCLTAFSSFAVLVLILILFFEVLSGRSRDEEKAVQSELSRLDDPEVQASNPFSADGARAQAFAVLRLWAERVPAALWNCQQVLGGIHAEFYPLQVVPSSFETLCRVFSQPAELRRVMNHQIHAGARAALGLVHSHWPGADIAQVVGVLLVAGITR